MSRSRSLSLALVMLVPLLWVVSAVAAWGKPAKLDKSTLQIAFQDTAVVASGLTPGQSVIWFGVEHQIDSAYSHDIHPHFSVGTAAADGTASLDLGRALIPGAIWVAVDLASGGYTVSAPDGASIAAPPPSLDSVLVAGGGKVSDQLVDHRPYLFGLAVRPGVGAWSFGGGDGGPSDVDGLSDGTLTFSLDQFEPLPGSPAAPAQADGTDLWFVIDPLMMQISVEQNGAVIQ
jgi:hypothetical protein